MSDLKTVAALVESGEIIRPQRGRLQKIARGEIPTSARSATENCPRRNVRPQRGRLQRVARSDPERVKKTKNFAGSRTRPENLG